MTHADDIAVRDDGPPAYRGRFAPSPTGPLHFGSLLAAFGSWLLARHAHGEWWVRVEDLDPPREVTGAAETQLRTLGAFGLVPDAPVVKQSTRHALYERALDKLLASGAAFACHCSRSDLAAVGGIHRRCVAHASRAPAPAIRLRVPDGTIIEFDDAIQGRVRQDVAAEVGDFVLRRADGYWAYQLAVVVDQFGRKLSKSLSALPIDAHDPLPALRAAWQALGQAPSALKDAGTVDAALDAARAVFDPAVIPAASIALHNTGVIGPA
jgi:glutamyl-Q tRNA(Asp) synthetase